MHFHSFRILLMTTKNLRIRTTTTTKNRRWFMFMTMIRFLWTWTNRNFRLQLPRRSQKIVEYGFMTKSELQNFRLWPRRNQKILEYGLMIKLRKNTKKIFRQIFILLKDYWTFRGSPALALSFIRRKMKTNRFLTKVLIKLILEKISVFSKKFKFFGFLYNSYLNTIIAHNILENLMKIKLWMNLQD